MALIPLDESMLDLVLQWRNMPVIRQNMYSSHVISRDEHLAWYRRGLEDPTIRHYVYVRDNEPAGFVYFTGCVPQQGNAFWGFYAAPEAPPGTGLEMELEALDHAFGPLGLHKLNCEVIAFNRTVINLHLRAGFREEGLFRDYHRDGERYHDVVRLGMLACEWSERRPALVARLTVRGSRHVGN